MHDPAQARTVLPSDNDDVTSGVSPSLSGEYHVTRRAVEHRAEPLGGTERIVVAEDDPNVRRVTQQILEELGYQVQVYASGPELLAALDGDEQLIEMLLTDFEMPGLTGYELAEQLRAKRPDIKVLLTSGMSEDSIAPAVRPPDWPHFIPKPFTMRSLGHKLREVLEGNP